MELTAILIFLLYCCKKHGKFFKQLTVHHTAGTYYYCSFMYMRPY